MEYVVIVALTLQWIGTLICLVRLTRATHALQEEIKDAGACASTLAPA
jgi:hypothetical protein